MKQLSKLAKSEKLKKALEWADDAVSADKAWQRERHEDYAFYAGHQWTDEERRILNEEERPALTFNLIKSTIDLITGMSIQNPVAVTPEPVEKTDQFLCDVVQEAIAYIDDNVNAEGKELEAFEDKLICGRGFNAIDISVDPKRPTDIIIEQVVVPATELRIDPACTEDDLSDARYIIREKWLSRDDFKIVYPDYKKEIDELMDGGLTVDFTSSTVMDGDVFDIMDTDSDESDYSQPLDSRYYDRAKDLIHVIHLEYWEAYQRFYGFNPMSNEVEEFDEKQLKQLKNAIPNFEYEKIWDKKLKWLHFIRDIILYDDDSPIPYDGFSVVGDFGYKDKSVTPVKHFGVVRLMKDPQKEVNKRWSQALNSLVTQGKGVMAETDAFVDIKQAQATWNDPRQITWLNKGGINMVQEKPASQFPQAAMQMEEMAQDIIKRITGVNADLLGIKSSSQEPGVTIRLRQSQGLTILAKLFNSFKEFKRQIYKRKIAIVAKYMPESQLKRILGQGKKYIIKGGMVVDKENGFIAPLRNIRDLDYNIRVQNAPGNVTRTMSELSIYMQMMQYKFPVDPNAVIERLDLTADEKASWMKYIANMQKSQAQQAQQTQQLEMAKLQSKTKTDMSKLQLQAKKAEDDKVIRHKAVDGKTQVGMAKVSSETQADMQDYMIALAQLDNDERRLVLDMIGKLSERQQPQIQSA